ncbi:MAG TPA: hypothetical protein VHF89_09450 [Solirubrobacteraceae bacterium]|nr:hypothetical protein [Solirubrobacteraceae bacterium]
MTIRLALLLAVAAALLAAPAAHGATATIADPPGDARQDLRTLTIVWENDVLTITVTHAGDQAPQRLDLLVSPASRREHDPRVLECDPDREGVFNVTVRRGSTKLRLGRGGATIDGETRVDGATATHRFADRRLGSAFSGIDPFACASGDADGDGFYGAFDGRVLKLTPATARDGLTAELTRRFGDRFTGSPRRAVRCPRRALSPAVEPGARAEAICAFRFDVGRRYRMGTVFVSLESGRFAFGAFRSRTFPLSLRHCGVDDGAGGFHAPPGVGAGIEVWGQRVSCRRARRVALRWDGRRRVGRFRCAVTARGEEFVAVRCTARGRRVVRFEAGA